MKQIYFFGIISLWPIICFILLFNYQTRINNEKFNIIFSISDNHDNYDDVGFNHSQIEQEKHRETNLENKYQLTAIILHWKRLSGVQKLIEYYLNTNLFKEIIVWNNNPQIYLTLNQLLTNNPSSNLIRIINSKKNLKDEAKYRACAQAQTLACFYADDDWDISHYIKSLIASFRSDPNVLHSITDPYTFYTNLMWSYFDFTINLHSGFSWIGCGSVFLRKHARRHLQLLEIYLNDDRNLMAFSDIFFSIWLNDIPSQMNINLRNLFPVFRKDLVSFSQTYGFYELQYKSSVRAIRILEHSLRMNQSNTTITFPRKQNRRFPYYVKSPSQNDNFIFYTNILPIDIEHMPFDISRDYERGTRKNLPKDRKVKYFETHTTSKVVDDDNKSCWRPGRSMIKGDFFAVDFLRIQSNITFEFIVVHSHSLPTNLDMRISLNGLKWISYRSLKGIFIKVDHKLNKEQYTMIVNTTQFASGFKSFRYVMFYATSPSKKIFNICEVKLI